MEALATPERGAAIVRCLPRGHGSEREEFPKTRLRRFFASSSEGRVFMRNKILSVLVPATALALAASQREKLAVKGTHGIGGAVRASRAGVGQWA
ncbi:hypothetical protein GCM10022419_083760 [Nonomuraea rosea]|uniref:Uncharacterized protein n=1 Tax=Nonomuraea rosea TaxID=638574 RepID=A0ABP6YTB1_9ACTN